MHLRDQCFRFSNILHQKSRKEENQRNHRNDSLQEKNWALWFIKRNNYLAFHNYIPLGVSINRGSATVLALGSSDTTAFFKITFLYVYFCQEKYYIVNIDTSGWDFFVCIWDALNYWWSSSHSQSWIVWS